MGSSSRFHAKSVVLGFLVVGSLVMSSTVGAQSAIDRIVNNPDYSTTYEAGRIVNSQRSDPMKGHFRDILKADRWQQVYGSEEAGTVGYSDPKDFIRQIQLGLSDWGLDPGLVDGVIGPQTTRAIKAYQLLNRLPVTGRPSADLFRRLKNPEMYGAPIKAQSEQ